MLTISTHLLSFIAGGSIGILIFACLLAGRET